MTIQEIKTKLVKGLTEGQCNAVRSSKRRVLIVAGAGSGKTEVMARRIAWWIGVEGVPKNSIVAFTFTEKAAEEMKLRVRRWIGEITPSDEDIHLGGMYVGTIHGFCLAKIREFWANDYHNYDILDEAARMALVLRGFNGVLGLSALRSALGEGQGMYDTIDKFTVAYDQLHEHNRFEIALSNTDPPFRLGTEEIEWCKKAQLLTDVGDTPVSKAFAESAARYYAYLRCRRFLDFSTSQTEFLRRLSADKIRQKELNDIGIHLVVDEVQDINPVQRDLMALLVGIAGKLTSVGDHRQSIYGFRGAKVEIIGDLWQEFQLANDAEVVDLRENFRSTPRIIEIANQWAETIQPVRTMDTPAMLHGKKDRLDTHGSHIALIGFSQRVFEAEWIAEAVKALVPSEVEGALHDKRDGKLRGLALSDIAVLVRSSTDVRTYMRALESAGIACIVRAGPDLFSQPEVLFFMAAIALTGGVEEFYGSPFNPKSMPKRIEAVLGCDPQPEPVLRAAARMLRESGLTMNRDLEDRVLFASKAICSRITNERSYSVNQVKFLRTPRLREFLSNQRPLRRVFPQQLFHLLLAEAEVENWDTCEGRGETAMFHLGALSGLITGIEMPGWTNAESYKWQIIGLCQYGAEEGRVEEQPLIVKPDAVTISTVHSVKGLEFAAVFIADVNAQRFPSSRARHEVKVPMSGPILDKIDIAGLSDNENHDGERRLMYVALTRAERFLFVSHNGNRTSCFIKQLGPIIEKAGGTVTNDSKRILNDIRYASLEHRREIQLCTSFSDLRYYLGCPHDFYLRKVLGFAPTIDQAFGYGRGVHNLMRAIHSDPKKWAALAHDDAALKNELIKLVDRGLFYLRYTTGDPAENMRAKGVRIVADYVKHFADELRDLTFEPEKEFETVVEYEDGSGGAMISGAIDIVRCDDPPRVTLIDFKSGDPDSDKHQKLDEDEMRLQVGIYAIAAKKELQYAPDKGLVRYLDVDREKNEHHQIDVPLDDISVKEAKNIVVKTANSIRNRNFKSDPLKPGSDGKNRCPNCDFLGFCGMRGAVGAKQQNLGNWGT
jgi:DNA helicase II / ATP-dependent DNA helicase PcrA